jgi:hypothetical protein
MQELDSPNVTFYASADRNMNTVKLGSQFKSSVLTSYCLFYRIHHWSHDRSAALRPSEFGRRCRALNGGDRETRVHLRTSPRGRLDRSVAANLLGRRMRRVQSRKERYLRPSRSMKLYWSND